MEQQSTLRHFNTIISVFTVSDIAEPIYMVARPEKEVEEIAFELRKPPEEWTEQEKESWMYGILPGELRGESPDDKTVEQLDRLLARKCLIKDADQIYGYTGAAVRYHYWLDGERAAQEVANPITPNQIVPSNMPLLDLIPLFKERDFYFVLNRNDITHIVNFMDMDKLPMKLCIFSLIIRLENTMYGFLAYNTEKTAENVEKFQNANNKRYTKIRLGLMKLYKTPPTPNLILRYTTIQDKWDILSYSSSIYEDLHFNTKKEADDFFKTTREVRNQIAHGESMLELLEEPTTFNDFIETLKGVTVEMINLLQNQ